LERLTAVAPRAPGRWQIATVASVKQETPSVKSFRLTVPMWMPHLPGQHYDVRLTAPDGYQAQRSYSIASSPLTEGEIELTIDCLLDGEVSPYFHDVVEPGDQIEVRGPFASYFVWHGTEPGPVLLVGGGSGVVPLMSVVRRQRQAGSPAPLRLVYSLRDPDAMLYRDELGALAADGLSVTYVFTRRTPEGWPRPAGRLDARSLAASAFAPAELPTSYVCGPTGFVETVADLLVTAGHDPARVRTERFGPSGGSR
jgi:ferredoxin-NADP reductase